MHYCNTCESIQFLKPCAWNPLKPIHFSMIQQLKYWGKCAKWVFLHHTYDLTLRHAFVLRMYVPFITLPDSSIRSTCICMLDYPDKISRPNRDVGHFLQSQCLYPNNICNMSRIGPVPYFQSMTYKASECDHSVAGVPASLYTLTKSAPDS